MSVCICAQRGELEGPLWICGCDVGPAALPVGLRAFENAGRLRHERERQDFERNRMEGRVPVAICGVAGLELLLGHLADLLDGPIKGKSEGQQTPGEPWGLATKVPAAAFCPNSRSFF